MIFLTIGTHEPFDRLVEAMDRWAGASGVEVFAQGAGRYRPRHFELVHKLDPDSYRARVEAADFLVAHAGMGSIITALDCGKPIVVMPRRGHLNETRNDHQWATARQLASVPGILVAEDEAALPALLDRLVAGDRPAEVQRLSPWASDELIAAVRGVIQA
ncbi:MAG: glycosyltransferase [Sphingomonadaceae bacterium]